MGVCINGRIWDREKGLQGLQTQLRTTKDQLTDQLDRLSLMRSIRDGHLSGFLPLYITPYITIFCPLCRVIMSAIFVHILLIYIAGIL